MSSEPAFRRMPRPDPALAERLSARQPAARLRRDGAVPLRLDGARPSPAVEPTLGTTSHAPDEAALCRAAAAGDRLSFRALYERTGASALRLAERIVRRRELAEEVCQEAYCQAWARLATFRGEARFRTWLLTIVRNAALDLLRRERTRKKQPLSELGHDVEGPAAPPHEPLALSELRGALGKALAELPEETRTAFTLAALDKLSYAEVASVLGSTTDSVKCRVYRAREHLRKRLVAYRDQGR